MQERELHGIAADKSLLALARHEAGHLLMLWLLDRYAVVCIITDEGGLTKVDCNKKTSAWNSDVSVHSEPLTGSGMPI